MNNAGVMATKPLATITEEDFDKHFAINVKGMFFAIQQATRVMSENGRIINLSTSVVGMMLPTPGPVNMELFTAGKSEEQIRMYASMNALGRLGESEDITKVVLFLVSDESQWTNGKRFASTVVPSDFANRFDET